MQRSFAPIPYASAFKGDVWIHGDFLGNIHAVIQVEEGEDPSANVDNIRATMTLSVLFHDAVYDPKSSTNEEDSAALYRTFASELSHAIISAMDSSATTTTSTTSTLASLPSHFFDYDRVGHYILATKHHNSILVSTNDICLKLFLDADMAVLEKHENCI
jgi:predicted metal-dependent HD superfamily phosphohydrolase